ncbi:MAG: hypothetical protein KAS72_10500 [Phycisphaerales bacterium]|nr:hypothetical protein [Phycisphaerales bacterium]
MARRCSLLAQVIVAQYDSVDAQVVKQLRVSCYNRHMTQELNPTRLTWAALLGRWIEFARAAVALPDDDQGTRWKASVAPIIDLQAVTMALGQLDDLPDDERALGLDKAEILIRRDASVLGEIWRDAPLPAKLTELLDDARQALRQAQSATQQPRK